MPSVYRFGLKKLMEHLNPLIEMGLSSILLFGVIDTLPKDDQGTNADSNSNPVIRALPLLRQAYPNLLIACDVCLCPYTSHGHCGIIENGFINNEKSIERIAAIALSYARMGAHIVAPSDMMDSSIYFNMFYLLLRGFIGKYRGSENDLPFADLSFSDTPIVSTPQSFPPFEG